MVIPEGLSFLSNLNSHVRLIIYARWIDSHVHSKRKTVLISKGFHIGQDVYF